jgi:hypothetical protein
MSTHWTAQRRSYQDQSARTQRGPTAQQEAPERPELLEQPPGPAVSDLARLREHAVSMRQFVMDEILQLPVEDEAGVAAIHGHRAAVQPARGPIDTSVSGFTMEEVTAHSLADFSPTPSA